MLRFKQSYWVVVATVLNVSCATRVFVFKTNSPAKIDLVATSSLYEPGTPLGETPLTVEVASLQGKVVRVSQAGKLPAFWIVSEAAGEKTEATFVLTDAPTVAAAQNTAAGGQRVDSKIATNRVLRLILRSYKEMSGMRFKAARELAEQAALLDPELAAPHLLIGMALFKEGNIEEAKSALAKAQALDPEDKDVDELLKVIR